MARDGVEAGEIDDGVRQVDRGHSEEFGKGLEDLRLADASAREQAGDEGRPTRFPFQRSAKGGFVEQPARDEDPPEALCRCSFGHGRFPTTAQAANR